MRKTLNMKEKWSKRLYEIIAFKWWPTDWFPTTPVNRARFFWKALKCSKKAVFFGFSNEYREINSQIKSLDWRRDCFERNFRCNHLKMDFSEFFPRKLDSHGFYYVLNFSTVYNNSRNPPCKVPFCFPHFSALVFFFQWSHRWTRNGLKNNSPHASSDRPLHPLHPVPFQRGVNNTDHNGQKEIWRTKQNLFTTQRTSCPIFMCYYLDVLVWAVLVTRIVYLLINLI